MTLLDRHPDAAALTRATDDALTEEEHASVSAHVAECVACAEDVTAARALAMRVRLAPVDAAPRSVIDGALARRRAGERVLLPVSDVEGEAIVADSMTASSAVSLVITRPLRRHTGAMLAAASLALATVGAWALLSPRGLDAAPPTERLRVVSGRAQAGQTVEVEYAALPALAGRESLVVRGYSRSEGAGSPVRWHDPLLVLHRDAARRFRGAFTWPSAAVLTVAVESADGAVVDANDGDLVDLLATDGAGDATFDALVTSAIRGDQRFGTPGGRTDAPALRARVAELERRFPDRVESWALAAMHAHSPTLWDAWFGAFARRTRALERLDRELGNAPAVPARAKRAMLSLARAQEEPEVAAEWARRVGGDTAMNPYADRERRVAGIVQSRDLGAARSFLRDSLHSAFDYFLAVRFGTFDRLGAPGDHAPLVPCAELQGAFVRSHSLDTAPRRPPGVTGAAFASWRNLVWARQQQVASQCGVSYPERIARYNAWARSTTSPDWAALRAIYRSPIEP